MQLYPTNSGNFELQPRFSSHRPTVILPQAGTNGHTTAQLRPHYNESDYIRFFRFYGLKLEMGNTNKQLIGECPFTECRSQRHESPDHFFASPATGCWDCKYCGRKGNVYSFIREFHSDCLNSTLGQSYYHLETQRPGIPAWVFPVFGLALNPINGEWLLPSYSLKDKEVTNLYAYKPKATLQGPVMSIYSGPTFKQILYGLQFFRKDHHRPILIAEGHWDHMALYGCLYLNNLLNDYDIVGTPGDKFPDLDIHLLSGRDVIHLGDNDKAGQRSFDNLSTQLGVHSITPRSLRRLAFNIQEPNGMDVRDIIASSVGHTIPQNATPNLNRERSEQYSPQLAWQNLSSRFYPVHVDLTKHANAAYSPAIRQIPCTSFDDVLESLEKANIYLPDCLKDTMAIDTAIAATTGVPGKPLWCHNVGPSGSGKTLLLSLVSSADPYCFFMSKWTGLVSGYYEKGLDNLSLASKVNGKCICIEDFTPTITEAQQTQDRLFSELREVYGGKITNSYKNPSGIVAFDNMRFNMLTCVTQVVRKMNNTTVGERFLICDQDTYWLEDGSLINRSIDRGKMVDASIENELQIMGGNQFDKYKEQRGICWGFIAHIATRILHTPEWVQSKVMILNEDTDTRNYYSALGQWGAYGRAYVDRDKEKQSRYDQDPEYGTRLAATLTKSAIVLSLLFDEEPNTKRVKSLVRKLALDTGYSRQLRMMITLAQSNVGCDLDDLVTLTNVSQTQVLNHLRDMGDLGVCEYRTPPYGLRNRGNQPHRYYLTESLQKLALTLGFSKETK